MPSRRPTVRVGRKLAAAGTAGVLAVTAFAVPASSASTPSARSSASHSATRLTAARQALASQRGIADSRVFGSFGRQGVVRGFFVPERSLVKAGRTYVQGELAVTLRRANGKLVGQVVRNNVSLPVRGPGAHTAAPAAAAAAATCNVLHLVLGPLDLNLLGLHVHLNRVVLDITAVPGAGNLLGNLLCAVANLLNNTNPGLLGLLKLSNLLNRVIGLLG